MNRLKQFCGLEDNEPWPKKFTLIFRPSDYNLNTLHQFQSQLGSMGYRVTSTVRQPDGITTHVWLRDGTERIDDPESLIREARAILQDAALGRMVIGHNPAWSLIDRINVWLGEG